MILLLSTSVYSQKLHHQMLSSQGNSKVLPNGMYISQSIGQQSVSGNYTVDKKTYGQGFQQSNWSRYLSQNNDQNSESTTTYPNPFMDNVNFQFSIPIQDEVSISLFDVRGRLIYSEIKAVNGNLLTVELPNLASSNYLVQLSARNYLYYTQILKQ
ncbi:T9SS type A sorting domain-containing protein [Flavobacterium sp. SUN046]|uniref:T9SS type A sorting domain-containing protein n=1 Tax=Flavobacterium sp. SUN046 TaxID=3002440 RepID=UPI002DBAC72E|nr:T9SS type A sorting domain-containing protein [Flavobacterium sp. SUN046]MEC4047950.1 T9SS type A sorting domain-containing protein [Flavobacterium sp. SUN046]